MNLKKYALLLAAAGLLLAGCGGGPVKRAGAKEPIRVERPPCFPNPGLKPGRGFEPALDPARTAAANALLARIAACEPLPFDHDAIIFQNREGLLPRRPRGYYREYTLAVPGRKTGDAPARVAVGTQTLTTGDITSPRGPERLVIGEGRRIYYTPDHYGHFVELQVVR
jgi:ribonuclease T1